MSGCPVDHSALAAQKKTETCPVDHGALSRQSQASSSSIWTRLFSSSQPKPSTSAPQLSTERELSSIPKAADGNWVYPSETQFFAAMDRKNHNPQAADMKTIVPIHNAVNERAWTEIMKWEAGRGGDACGGVKLVNFKGRPGDMSPKARWKSFLGYAAPFDRHDWIVDRCGTRTRYIIDFYTGRSQGAQSNLSFYLDVRPALDNWEGVKMRASHFWGSLWQNSTPKHTS
ncbi:cytochrome c/c1 heme-lyase [Armillaria novae-zelandiae]|uniref:Holocytochrome c-type synthase n=1 Tax=Armillaria novae-zelandiae TaxID=153914 RepID=A0AA39PH85_9AGAR|nr:cytochrome c/c1 heme-lyase [Armillaria novae-zelandiae]